MVNNGNGSASEGVVLTWKLALAVTLPAFLLAGVAALGLTLNYLAFHVLAELVSVTVAFAALIVATTSQTFKRNDFLVYIAIAMGWCALIDLAHTLVFRGMGLLPGNSANPATQLWVGARYLQALGMATAPWFLRRQVRAGVAHLAFGLATVGIIGTVSSGHFPDAYVDGQGLTPFKVYSEYVIILLFVAALARMWRSAARIPQPVLLSLTTALVAMILSEFSFTRYVGVYATANMVGHLLKIVATWFVFLALIYWSLRTPYSLLERSTGALEKSEERFRLFVDGVTDYALIMLDVHGHIVGWNAGAQHIDGYRSEDILGRHFSCLFPAAEMASGKPAMLLKVAAERGRCEEVGLRVRQDGSQFWANAIITPVHDSTHTRIGFSMVTRDITERKQHEQALIDAAQKTERAMFGTVNAVSRIMGIRDPYTAGHEQRVGEISSEIAAEMGLGADFQRGVRVAGGILDIGKITVPAEILSKPSRLSAIEFEMVKTHAQQGYEVLKDIDFPWPVAEVARQHHERVDGSGYPRGLKGDAILLEARVLAVADVLEAVTSHRPHRPGLGIEEGLRILEQGRGTAFDPQVVDACLRLFRDRHYVMPALV